MPKPKSGIKNSITLVPNSMASISNAILNVKFDIEFASKNEMSLIQWFGFEIMLKMSTNQCSKIVYYFFFTFWYCSKLKSTLAMTFWDQVQSLKRWPIVKHLYHLYNSHWNHFQDSYPVIYMIERLHVSLGSLKEMKIGMRSSPIPKKSWGVDCLVGMFWRSFPGSHLIFGMIHF